MYKPTEWKDEIVEHPYRYIETEENGSVTHTPDFGETIQEGTPLSASKFNNIENGVYDAWLAVSILLQSLRTEKHAMNNAGGHNSIFRGICLGSKVTDDQYSVIKDGTFEGMFIGDYWSIGDDIWRIAAFDYYYDRGDVHCLEHHVVIVPDEPIDSSGEGAQFNSTATFEGGYASCEVRQALLQSTYIADVFGESHILEHRNEFVNAVTNGKPSGVIWQDSKVELMSQANVLGFLPFIAPVDADTPVYMHGLDNVQFPLFRLSPQFITSKKNYWLRDVIASTKAGVGHVNGDSSYGTVTSRNYVRPSFCLVASTEEEE